jgi:hypothetical protein
MIELIHDTGKLRMASTLPELTIKQVRLVAAIIHSELTEYQARLAMVKVLSNKNWFGFWRIPADVRHAATEHVDWIFDAAQTNHTQWLPKYRGMYGPDSELMNVVLSEFHFCETYYRAFREGEDMADLNRLVACLYRPAKWFYNKAKNKDGDIRQPFNANLVEFYARRVAKWPTSIKQAILLFYAGCRSKLTEDYKEVFSGSEDQSGSEQDMFVIIRNLSGERYGDFEKTEYLLLHTALRELELIGEEQEALKQNMPS